MLDKGAKILIVDDMKLIRTAIRKYLTDVGYTNIVEAENGEDAVAKHAAEKPAFIFLDIVMPKMTGAEALKEIRKTDKKTPIVMLTSVAEENMIESCRHEGILDYAIKPINKDIGPKLVLDLLAKA
jgi:CheY-like chemotaxis protein